MTELEWANCTDPDEMFAFLRGKVTDRKLYLFSAACHRKGAWDRLPPEWRKWAEAEEQYADERISFAELTTALRHRCGARDDEDVGEIQPLNLARCEGEDLAKDAGEWAVYDAEHAKEAADEELEDIFDAAYARARGKQCHIIRDLVGSPFRSIVMDPVWTECNSPVVFNIAVEIYENRAFDRLPILADALEQAGCANVSMLDHCRKDFGHVRGCWVVDLLLGKE